MPREITIPPELRKRLEERHSLAKGRRQTVVFTDAKTAKRAITNANCPDCVELLDRAEILEALDKGPCLVAVDVQDWHVIALAPRIHL